MFKRLSLTMALAGIVIFAVLFIATGEARSAADGPGPAVSLISSAATGWSSGWFAITPGATEVLTHSLGGDVGDYAVELMFLDADAGGLGINTFGYGGFEDSGQWEGGYWSDLTITNISVHRMPNDETADMMRVRVWFMTPADYDSGWEVITPTLPLTLSHNLGTNSEDYTLSLWFQDDTPDGYGIHNRYFGSIEQGGQYEGAHWQNLDESDIVVRRWTDDTDVDQVRLRIVQTPPPPAFDSGWTSIVAGETITLTHDLGGQAGHYRVSLQYRDVSGLPTSFGRNMLWAGGEAVGSNLFGGHWQRLNNSTVQLYRQPGGTNPRDTEVRLRIWAPGRVVYLPLVTKN
ncbi:MAG: hypothetical protein ACP5GX_09090 [Anaerolineae bacterium]